MKKILLIITFLISEATYAQVYDFLNDTPGSYFNDRDWAIYLNTQKKALNNTPDGGTVTWKNPENGHWGSFEPTHTTINEGVHCRDLEIYNDAEGRTGGGTLKFCKIDGNWKGI